MNNMQIISYINNPNQQLNNLVNLFKTNGITVVDFLIENQNSLIITGTTLNCLAIKIHNGHDGIIANHSEANRLYELAATKGSVWAKFNLAENLLLEEPKNLLKADILFTEVERDLQQLKGFENSFYCRFGECSFHLGQYRKAWRYFNNVSEHTTVNQEKKVVPQFEWAQTYLGLIKQRVQDTLNTTVLYIEKPAIASADNGNVSGQAVAEITEGVSQLAVVDQSRVSAAKLDWVKLGTSLLDMHYDPERERNIIIALRKAELNCELAISNLNLVTVSLSKARASQESEDICAMFQEFFHQKRTAVDDANSVFYIAKEKNDELIAIPDKKQHRRQVQSEKHFFASERNRNVAVRDIASQLLQQRQRERGKTFPAVVVTDIPVRHVIAAELAVIRASLKVMGMPPGYNNAAFPWTVGLTETRQGERISYTQLYSNDDQIQCGPVTITYRHRIDPHENHVGDFYMSDLGDYWNINNQLQGLIMDSDLQVVEEKEKQLAQLMLRYTKTGNPVTLDELQTLKQEATENDVCSVMRIFYHCFVKEPASWMIPRDEDHELPLATLQLRAVKLIAAGYLHIADVFGKNSNYGVFTGENIGKNISVLLEKMKKINKSYFDM